MYFPPIAKSVAKIKENRQISDQQIEEIAQGQMFTGEEALELKLIDKLGNLNDTIGFLKKEAGITGQPEIVIYRSQPDFLKFFRGLW